MKRQPNYNPLSINVCGENIVYMRVHICRHCKARDTVGTSILQGSAISKIKLYNLSLLIELIVYVFNTTIIIQTEINANILRRSISYIREIQIIRWNATHFIMIKTIDRR